MVACSQPPDFHSITLVGAVRPVCLNWPGRHRRKFCRKAAYEMWMAPMGIGAIRAKMAVLKPGGGGAIRLLNYYAFSLPPMLRRRVLTTKRLAQCSNFRRQFQCSVPKLRVLGFKARSLMWNVNHGNAWQKKASSDGNQRPTRASRRFGEAGPAAKRYRTDPRRERYDPEKRNPRLANLSKKPGANNLPSSKTRTRACGAW
jgi:hypothetical protein